MKLSEVTKHMYTVITVRRSTTICKPGKISPIQSALQVDQLQKYVSEVQSL
jgi:hypothetical protein